MNYSTAHTRPHNNSSTDNSENSFTGDTRPVDTSENPFGTAPGSSLVLLSSRNTTPELSAKTTLAKFQPQKQLLVVNLPFHKAPKKRADLDTPANPEPPGNSHPAAGQAAPHPAGLYLPENLDLPEQPAEPGHFEQTLSEAMQRYLQEDPETGPLSRVYGRRTVPHNGGYGQPMEVSMGVMKILETDLNFEVEAQSF